jgi:CubicO group peptidase (beta-lactamase class C family)
MNAQFALFLVLMICCWNDGVAALESAHIAAAARYSAAQNGQTLLIQQGGRVVFEEYTEGSSRGGRKIFSGTKAFWNLAALAAQEDGLLDLDDRAAETITEWSGDSRKARITVRQLLDFSSGLDPGFFLHNNDPGNRDTLAMSLPLVADPGSAFIYGPSSLQVFHQILKRKLGSREESPTRYLERRVLRRMGLGSQRYLADRAGNPLLATGWILSPRQWAKMGQLVLANGSPVLAAGSLAATRRGSPVNRAFALGWWNNHAAPGGREFDIEDMLEPKWHRQDWSNVCICRDAPDDLVASIGSGYQRLYVIPSLQLVVVRNGAGGKFSDARFLRLLLGR